MDAVDWGCRGKSGILGKVVAKMVVVVMAARCPWAECQYTQTVHS